MHDLGKGSEQRVCDVVKERWVCVKVGQSLCLKLETFATEVAVYEVEHGTLGGIGRVDRRKRSKDRLGARVCGLVDKGFRVRPEPSDVDGLQELYRMG